MAQKYNYPASYLTKDGKIKKAFAKKAAEFRRTHAAKKTGGYRGKTCYTRKSKDDRKYVTCNANVKGSCTSL